MGRLTWFEVLLRVFAAALPIGLAVIVAAPVEFVHALGVLILGTGLIGLWVCALGLQLEHPERWHAIKATLRRIAPPATFQASIVDRR